MCSGYSALPGSTVMRERTMREPASLVVVRNPFDRRIRDEHSLSLEQMPTVACIVRDHLPLSAEVSVAINGELITRDEWESRTIQPGEQLVVMPVVHGDNPLGTILMIAVMVVATTYGGPLGTYLSFTGATATAVGTALIMTAGSMIVGGLTAPNRSGLPGTQSYNNSPAYSWNPATTQQPGGAVARAYGRHKLYGNIIAGYIENQGSGGRDQVAHLLIDLGTGPYSQLSDFQINDQPVGNYSGVTITARMGHVNQTTIPAFNDTRATHPIGAKVVKNTPVIRNTIGTDYDALEIVLLCPQGLWYANDAGGMDALSVLVAVEISADNGATWSYVATEPYTVVTVNPGYWSCGHWVNTEVSSSWLEVVKGSSVRADHIEGALQTPATWPRNSWRWMAIPTRVSTTVNNSITLSGSTQQPIRRQLRVDHLVRGTRYQVRCTNLSTDQTSSRYGDDLYLAEINEVMYDDFQYPRTVLAAVDALATNQLSGSIKFSCMGDCAIVRVWNGATWSSAWSNNPAWVCWDVLTQPVLDNNLNVVRYDGLDPSRLILSTFKAWSDFCDVQVPNGLGGMEARCAFDGIFDTTTSMWDAALEVCASARAQLVMRGTSVAVVVDDVRSTPAQLFSVGNTAVAGFSESWLKMQDRAASIECGFIDSAQGYTRDSLTIVNPAITESTAQRTQLGLRGVTRASQVWREMWVKLKRNELLRRSGVLNVDIDALACTVGDLIWVQSDVTRWGEGGRAASGSTTTHLVLDKAITLDAGKAYELKLRLGDDTLVTRAITTAAGSVSAVDVSVAFPSAPALYDVWAIGETGKAVKEFIVLDVVRDGDQRAKISLIEYNVSLYGLDSGIPALPTPDVSASALPSVGNIRVEEVMELAAGGVIVVHLDLHFDMTEARAVSVFEDGRYIGEGTGVFRRANVNSGSVYNFTLHPVSLLGISPSGTWQSISYSVIGKLAPPLDVSGFVATRNGNDLYFNWPRPAELDVAGWEIRLGTTWDSAVAIGSTPRNSLTAVSPQGGTFLIKAFDTCVPVPNYSINAAQCILSANTSINVILTDDDATYGWPGTLNGMVMAGTVLNLGYVNTWAGMTQPWNAYTQNWMHESVPLAAGNYITDMHDIGQVLSCNLHVAPDIQVVAFGQTWASWDQPWAFYANNYSWAGPLGMISATYEINTSLDNITWTGWQPFAPGLRTLRYYKMRASFTAQPGYQIQVNHFPITVDVPDRVARYANLAVPSGGLALAFTPAFNAVNTIKVNLLNGLAGDSCTINNKTINGADLNVYDSIFAAKAGTVDVEVFGY